ncbi:MAG: ATP phosphoribosyltransferase [Candidatus Thorarchaeota archaeon]
MNKVKLALPKGHLSDETLRIFTEAGYSISGSGRTYCPRINDEHITLRILRPQEIPLYVQEGLIDIGITGKDWIRETNAEVDILIDLEYSKVRLVLAVPKEWSDVNSLSDLLEKRIGEGRNVKISTEYLNIAEAFIKEMPAYVEAFATMRPSMITPWWSRRENERVRIILSFGATEAKPLVDADAILEVVDTGTSLDQNGLKVIEVVMDSSAVLIANKSVSSTLCKAEKTADIVTLLRGVVEARKKLHIFVNVREDDLEDLLGTLPALKTPTISKLAGEGWCAINTVIDREEFLSIMPTMRRLAQGLVVYEPRQILPLESVQSGGE